MAPRALDRPFAGSRFAAGALAIAVEGIAVAGSPRPRKVWTQNAILKLTAVAIGAIGIAGGVALAQSSSSSYSSSASSTNNSTTMPDNSTSTTTTTTTTPSNADTGYNANTNSSSTTTYDNDATTNASPSHRKLHPRADRN